MLLTTTAAVFLLGVLLLACSYSTGGGDRGTDDDASPVDDDASPADDDSENWGACCDDGCCIQSPPDFCSPGGWRAGASCSDDTCEADDDASPRPWTCASVYDKVYATCGDKIIDWRGDELAESAVVAYCETGPSSGYGLSGSIMESIPNRIETCPGNCAWIATCVSGTGEIFEILGTADGNYPTYLAPDAQYDFAFDVTNWLGDQIAIKKVAISLPDTNYRLDAGDLGAPWALHPSRGAWTVVYAEATGTVTWEFHDADSGTAGDIELGEDLTFSIVATTDAAATDGFAWTLTGDDSAVTVVEGVYYFTPGAKAQGGQARAPRAGGSRTAFTDADEDVGAPSN